MFSSKAAFLVLALFTVPQPSISAPPVVKGTADPPPGVIGGLLGALFPVPGFSKSWTTCPVSENAIPLNSAAFRPFQIVGSAVFVNGPDGQPAIHAHYPKGSSTIGNPQAPKGGFSFYGPGPASVDLKTAREATFGYRVFFPNGFGFQLGGKLPGLYGGRNENQAIGCLGSHSNACFSASLRWRSGGAGQFYDYLPASGRGSFNFATGQWTTISERVRLNTPGQADGELELFVNGQSIINVNGLVLRDSSAGRILGMQMQTFFGAADQPGSASPKDQDAFFSDFSVAITETL